MMNDHYQMMEYSINRRNYSNADKRYVVIVVNIQDVTIETSSFSSITAAAKYLLEQIMKNSSNVSNITDIYTEETLNRTLNQTIRDTVLLPYVYKLSAISL